MHKRLINTIIFIGSLWPWRTQELIGMWHNWFRLDLAKRDTMAAYIPSFTSLFIQQTCQILG